MNFKKSIIAIVSLCFYALSTYAQSSKIEQDSAKLSDLTSIEQIIINANQTKTKGSNVNTLDEKQIRAVNTGRDIPILLQTLPNVITTSDAGNGVG